MTGSSQLALESLRIRVAELEASEQLYRDLARLSPIPTWITLEDSIVFVNPAALQLLLASDPALVLGRSPAAFLQLRLEAESKQQSGILVDWQGRQIAVSVSSHAVGYQGKRAEIAYFKVAGAGAEAAAGSVEPLRARELAGLEQLYWTAPVGLAFTDLQHRYIRLNQKLAEFNGSPAAAHVGRGVRDMLPELAGKLEPVLNQVIASGEPIGGLEVTGVTPAHPGVEHTFLIHCYPVRNGSDKVLGVSAVVQEISRIKAVEAEMRQAKQRLETVVSSIQDAFMTLDNTWRVTYANQRAAALFRQSAEEFPGKLFLDVLSDMGSYYAQALLRAKSDNKAARMETRVASSGAWIESLIYPSADGVSILFRDTSALKTAEQEKRQSESIYRAIGESIDYGVWIADWEGRLIYYSESFLKLLGLKAEEASGFGFVKKMRPDAAERTVQAWENCVRGGSAWDAEYWLHGVDGQWHPILSRGVPVRNEANEIVYWAGVHLDIRAFKDAEQGLEETNGSLARTNSELEQFAYIASHDLQEPLRVIRLMARLLSQRYLKHADADVRAYLSTIEDSAERMSNLIRDLLGYSRVLHSHPLPNQMAELDQALERAIQNCQSDIKESGAILHVAPLPQARAEIEEISRVFQNLIANAIKYRREAPPEITISADERGAEWRFCVSDNGEGIAPDHHLDIFLPFKRLHGQEIPGSGIGLSVCKKIVERHGGRIWVECEPGAGACFYFTLPAE